MVGKEKAKKPNNIEQALNWLDLTKTMLVAGAAIGGTNPELPTPPPAANEMQILLENDSAIQDAMGTIEYAKTEEEAREIIKDLAFQVAKAQEIVHTEPDPFPDVTEGNLDNIKKKSEYRFVIKPDSFEEKDIFFLEGNDWRLEDQFYTPVHIRAMQRRALVIAALTMHDLKPAVYNREAHAWCTWNAQMHEWQPLEFAAQEATLHHIKETVMNYDPEDGDYSGDEVGVVVRSDALDSDFKETVLTINEWLGAKGYTQLADSLYTNQSGYYAPVRQIKPGKYNVRGGVYSPDTLKYLGPKRQFLGQGHMMERLTALVGLKEAIKYASKKYFPIY